MKRRPCERKIILRSFASEGSENLSSAGLNYLRGQTEFKYDSHTFEKTEFFQRKLELEKQTGRSGAQFVFRT
ncbi:hypothetical protein CH376_05805 [Leptospira adleri]|uniref:Uncharacterized protein n=1 Tax=Leptospira adleri TaxID=2023186 RepID=A0ABX4P139_9LEPT|nr:hypothetical protein CH376_05805 [Leptospira adleri]